MKATRLIPSKYALLVEGAGHGVQVLAEKTRDACLPIVDGGMMGVFGRSKI
jgi:hypothetical protein